MGGKERFERRQPTPDTVGQKSDILARLERAVGAIQDSESFQQYLAVQARFHRYSFGNVALILSQQPDATKIAGYHTWLKMGRHVRRGETGIRIVVPMRRGASVNEQDEQAKPQERRVFFGSGVVFDICQTEGDPLPSVDVPVLAGEEGRELYERLEVLALAEQLSVRVGSDQELGEDRMGYYEPTARAIVLRDAGQRQKTKTLAHELGHHFGAIGMSRPENETMAEAVAYVVCQHFELDTGERSIPYIATWSQDRQVLREVLGKVQAASARIIDAIEPPGTTIGAVETSVR